MSNRNYDTIKFLYTSDREREVIKRQRVYKNSAGGIDTPITPLFEAKVVDFEEKVTGTSKGLRHLLVYTDNGRQLKTNIPYAPGDDNLVAHAEEILAAPQVDCGDYFGERLITGGTTNSFQ